jgi:hypothetical protein
VYICIYSNITITPAGWPICRGSGRPDAIGENKAEKREEEEGENRKNWPDGRLSLGQCHRPPSAF